MDNESMSNQHDSPVQEHFSKLQRFRQAAYGLITKGRDALFELSDAVLQMPRVQCFAELSCAPAFRRKWPSVYEALQDGRLNRGELCKLYLLQFSSSHPLILALDHTAWPRVWANTLCERSYQHQPSPLPGHRPVTIGHGYSTLAIVPEANGSWALPVLHERISQQSPVQQAAAQLQAVCPLLAVRPCCLLDAEYGCAPYLLATADLAVDHLIRLRGNLALEGPPPAYKGRGRHPIHGPKFCFKDPATWPEPDEIQAGEDAQSGPFTARIWHTLRFSKALNCPMRVACLERPNAAGTRRKPKIVWFAWVGQPPPPAWWQRYCRRYPIDHWYRFAKGRLHWLEPKVATPQQAELWSDLMPFLTWELWLARLVAPDQPLPWQKAQPTLTPGRVCQGMPSILAAIGSPTQVCKPRGKSPGWPKGRARTHRERYDPLRSEREKLRKDRQGTRTIGLKTNSLPANSNAPPPIA